MIVSIDFETRSRVELTDRGLDNYAKDPSTEVICMAYVSGENDIGLWTPEMDMPDFMTDPDTVFQGWNVAFECNILRHVLGIPVKWSNMIDSMAIAAANNIPQSLEEAAIFLGTIEKKDPEGKRLIQKLSKPQKDGTFNTDPELIKSMHAYCIQDVKTEMAVVSKLRRLTAEEQRVWVLTQEINERGVPVDEVELQNAVNAVTVAKESISNEIHELTGGISASQPASLLMWLEENHGISMHDMTAESVSAMLLNKQLPEVARRVLELRAAGSSTSVTKFKKMLDVQHDGRIRNLFVYHGASTGRWASRGGLNIQNLPRPDVRLKDDDIQAITERVLVQGQGASVTELSSVVRSVLKAPEGYAFIDADFSSIENRVAAWLPNQKDKLKMFEAGMDEYKVFASESMYMVPYEEVTKDMRQISKSAVLGCMFGQGGKGLVAYAEGMGVKMALPQAEMAVKKYRESYHKVKACWYEMEAQAIAAIKMPGVAFTIETKRVSFKVVNNVLWMRLPSGRLICWQAPEVSPQLTPWGKMKDGITVINQNTVTRKWGRNELIGSSIFQSGVQAIARDLLALGLLGLEDAGYNVIGCFHDEILRLELAEDADSKLSQMIDIMTTQPDWAKDLPLAAEGWVDTRFRK